MEADLAKWDYGQLDGRRFLDIRLDDPGWDIWCDGCPGGESVADISDRADRLIERLALKGGTVALLSHGQFGVCWPPGRSNCR